MLDADRETLARSCARALRRWTRRSRRSCGWAQRHGIDVALASDGFGFYIEPLLAAAGVPPDPGDHERPDVDDAGRPGDALRQSATRTASGAAHARCRPCSRRRGARRVAFVGEGSSDRYGALYADVTFAKLDAGRALRARRRAVRSLDGLRRRAALARGGSIAPRTRRARTVPRLDRTLSSACSASTCPTATRPGRRRVTTSRPRSELVAACERHDDGVAEVARNDIAADWDRPDFDLETMSIGVWAGTELAASRRRVHGPSRGRMSRRRIAVAGSARLFSGGPGVWREPTAGSSSARRCRDKRTDAARRSSARTATRPATRRGPLRIDLGDEPPAALRAAGRPHVPRLPPRGRRSRPSFEVIDVAFDEWADRDSHGSTTGDGDR